MNWEMVGNMAAFMTSTAFIPQIMAGIRNRHLKDLSYLLSIFFVIGNSLWLAYGIYLKSFPMIVANIASLVFNIILIGMKFGFEHHHRTKSKVSQAGSL
jgi:MtN3 and saliva related transmembrane protein